MKFNIQDLKIFLQKSSTKTSNHPNHSSVSFINYTNSEITYLTKLSHLWEKTHSPKTKAYLLLQPLKQDYFFLYFYQIMLRWEKFRYGSDVKSIFMLRLFKQAKHPSFAKYSINDWQYFWKYKKYINQDKTKQSILFVMQPQNK